MGASPLRLLSAAAALSIAGALLPVGAAIAAPDPARTTEVAATACADAMGRYRLSDDVLLTLKRRQEAWREVVEGRISGVWAESGWSADAGQITGLQIAAAWMDPRLVARLDELDDDSLRGAEDDLVWAVQHLADDDLARVLQLDLDERSRVIARYRERAAQGSVRSDPAAADRTDAAAAATAERPVDTGSDVRPDVPVAELRRFEDRVLKARDRLPAEQQDAVQRQVDSGLVHDYGTTADLLDWTAQQGERGDELLAAWSDDTAAYAIEVRSVLAAPAPSDTYGGVLDRCITALVDRAGDDGLDEDAARELAARDIAGRLEEDGTIRAEQAATAGSAHLRACAAAVVAHAEELRLDDAGIAAVSAPDAPRALDDVWQEKGLDAEAVDERAVDVTVGFWSAHAEDDATARWLETVAGDGSRVARDALQRCIAEVPEYARSRQRVDASFLGRVAERSVLRTIAAQDVPPVEEPTPVDPTPVVTPSVDPAPVEPAPLVTAPAPTPTETPTASPDPVPTDSASATPTVEPTAPASGPAPTADPQAVTPVAITATDPEPVADPVTPAPAAPESTPAVAVPTAAPVAAEPVAEPVASDPDAAAPADDTSPPAHAPASASTPAPPAAAPAAVVDHASSASSTTVSAADTVTATTDVAPLTDADPVVEKAAQDATADQNASSSVTRSEPHPAPVGLLALLVPILLGGGVVTALTLRRLR